MRSLRFYLPGLLLGLVITFVSCTKNDDNVNPIPVQKDAQLNISMVHMITNSFVEFDKIQYTNAFGNLYSVITLKYFVSDFRFNKADGSSVFVDEEFYVDGSDGSTVSFIPVTKIPPGDYTSISFVFGLTDKKNVAGAFPNSPENAMEWPAAPLEGMYHYMKLEGKVDSSGVINNYNAHFGPTNGNLNYVNVTLPESSFSADTENLFLNIVMDINKWWANPTTLDLNEIDGIMGNQDVQEIFKANGQDVFSVGTIE